LYLSAIRDPERNRLREVYADKNTYEVTRLIAHDRLFDDGSHKIYDTTFDIRVGQLEGRPVVLSIHGEVGKASVINCMSVPKREISSPGRHLSNSPSGKCSSRENTRTRSRAISDCPLDASR